jgi:hypothetical protein
MNIYNRVNALAWDAKQGVLYIGGHFHAVDNRSIPAGLAVWSYGEDIMAFPGGGLMNNNEPGEVQALAFESRSKVAR